MKHSFIICLLVLSIGAISLAGGHHGNGHGHIHTQSCGHTW